MRVAEVSREVTKLFGINWEGIFSPGDFLFGLATGRAFTTAGGLPVPACRPTPAASATRLSGSYSNGDVSVNGIIDALEREGLVNVLAEPNLTALSGETASFLAGGEFPVPVGQDDNNNIEIQFKQFGVSLAFTPTVLSAGRISMRVRPEVSDLSDKGAIKLNDLVIPALSTRRAETTVELGSGQSFAIGGLISNSTRNNLDKVPGLGDLPVLGTLFRSTRFQRSESELVIIVTPYLVAPVGGAQLATPRDGLEDPSDLQRLIEGRLARTLMRTRAASQPLAAGGGVWSAQPASCWIEERSMTRQHTVRRVDAAPPALLAARVLAGVHAARPAAEPADCPSRPWPRSSMRHTVHFATDSRAAVRQASARPGRFLADLPAEQQISRQGRRPCRPACRRTPTISTLSRRRRPPSPRCCGEAGIGRSR